MDHSQTRSSQCCCRKRSPKVKSQVLRVVCIRKYIMFGLVNLCFVVCVLIVRVEGLIVFLVRFEELVHYSLLLVEVSRLLILNVHFVVLVLKFPQRFERHSCLVQNLFSRRIDVHKTLIFLKLLIRLNVLLLVLFLHHYGECLCLCFLNSS